MNQMPTPEIAPKTVETRIRIFEPRFASSRSDASPRRTERVSITARTIPPPTAKCETTTWRMATVPTRTPPPTAEASSQIG